MFVEIFEEKGVRAELFEVTMHIFKKGEKRAKGEKWQWEGKEVEVVKVFKYLGLIMQSNNGFGEHIRYIKKKARVGMGAVWGIGERYWKGDLHMRWKLTDFSRLRPRKA